MTQIKTKIPAELEPAAVGGMVTDSKYVKDRVKNKTQEEVNADTEERVSTLEESVGTGGSVDERIAVEKNRAEQAEGVLDGKVATEKQRAEGVEGGLNTRLQTVEELATISVGGGDIGIGTAADFESDDPEDLAKVPTVGAMLGGANDGVYDISVRHSGATYADLAAALGTNGTNVPVGVRKGGMSVKFVQSSDNKYVQYRLMSDTFNTTPANWQGVDDEPTAGSENLVKSKGVYDAIAASEIPLVDEGGFHVVDESLNIGMKYDKKGFDAAKVSSHFIDVLKAAGVNADDVMASHAAVVNEDGFFIADESLNVGVKVDNDGIHAKNILEYEIIEY